MQAVIERNKAIKKAKKPRKLSEKLEINLNQYPQECAKKDSLKKPSLLEEKWVQNSIQPFRLTYKALGKLKNFIQGKKKLDAAFEGEPVREIEVEKEKSFTWNICLKNNGTERWAENIRLECIQGPFKGLSEKIESIEPGFFIKVDFQFLASEKVGKEMVNFRICYEE